MKFFSKEQKELALKVDRYKLQSMYEETEKRLRFFAFHDDLLHLESEMNFHKLVEYALLYQLTTDFPTSYMAVEYLKQHYVVCRI